MRDFAAKSILSCIVIAFIPLLISCASSPRYKKGRSVVPQTRTTVEVKKQPEIIVEKKYQSPEVEIIREKEVIQTVQSTPDSVLTTPIVDTGDSFIFVEEGLATYYADKFHGKRTASGERYNKNELTAAHPKLPFNTLVRVTAVTTGKSVIVRINDRGPFTKKRVIDISKAAAREIDLLMLGITKVKVEIAPSK